MSMKERLVALRTERGCKQADLANIFSVSISTVSNWENGRNLDNETLCKLADFYGVSVEYLLCRTNERVPDNGHMASMLAALHATIGDTAITFAELSEFAEAAAQYYAHSAPCGDAPMYATRGFLAALTKCLNAAVQDDYPALMDQANAAVIAALEITKMPARYLEAKET